MHTDSANHPPVQHHPRLGHRRPLLLQRAPRRRCRRAVGRRGPALRLDLLARRADLAPCFIKVRSEGPKALRPV
jgi:hypothetical protein